MAGNAQQATLSQILVFALLELPIIPFSTIMLRDWQARPKSMFSAQSSRTLCCGAK